MLENVHPWNQGVKPTAEARRAPRAQQRAALPGAVRRLAAACSLALLSFSTATRAAPTAPPPELEKLVLQLKWQHQFQFAGYYLALERGYYRAAGLDVELREAVPGSDAVAEVLSGRADLGVGTTELLLRRSLGAPVVVLAVIFQHSPFGLAVRRDHGIEQVHNLPGKRVMVEPGATELYAMMEREHVPRHAVQLLPYSHIDELIDGKVDASSVYVTDETWLLDQARVPYLVLTARETGIDFYGDNLFTAEKVLQAKGPRLAAFVEASKRGWREALADPERTVDLVLDRYHPRGMTRDHLLYEARRTREMILPDVVELGYMYRGRWQHIADTYQELGLLPQGFLLDGFLHQPAELHTPTWLIWALCVAALVTVLVSAFSASLLRATRRLRRALDEIQTLRGILTICMHCKRIRGDRGTWEELERYVSDHSDARFSHGLCPDCLVAHYPGDHGLGSGRKRP
jgi:ABC-type nitrate/sulfonate/bicarbonate transport system substrate-binding protein